MGDLSAEKAQPQTLDPDSLSMHLLASGVRVATVGEDGDVMLMGHHDNRTAWVLFAEYQRYEGNGVDLTEQDAEVYDVLRRFASFSDHSEGCDQVGCECEADDVCAACRRAAHADCEDPCLCADDYDHDRPKEWPCSCECYCDEYAWWVNETKSGHEVTWVRYSWAKAKAQRERTSPPGQERA